MNRENGQHAMRTLCTMNLDALLTPTWLGLGPTQPLLAAGGILSPETNPEHVFDWHRPIDDTQRYHFAHQDTLSGHLAPFVGTLFGHGSTATERSFCLLAAEVGQSSLDPENSIGDGTLAGKIIPDTSEDHLIDFDQPPRVARLQKDEVSACINFNEWQPQESEELAPKTFAEVAPRHRPPQTIISSDERDQWPTRLAMMEHSFTSDLGTARFAAFASLS